VYSSNVEKGNTNSPLSGRGVKVFDSSRLQYMTDQSRRRAPRRPTAGARALGIVAALAAAACSGGHGPAIPDPRPIVNFAGARIHVDKDRMAAINDWVNKEQTNITNDPAFFVDVKMAADEVYPWERMRMSNDTVDVYIDPRAADSRLPLEIYGHLHLMAKMGRLEEWLPEAAGATGYELERAILSRVSDAWLLGRTVFDVPPYGPLDELIYAKESGYLDAFIFTARPDEFAEARGKWARENPGKSEEYRTWFLQTFNREPPGLRVTG
jgi:hypothetical protein